MDSLLAYLPGTGPKTGWPWTEETDPQIYRELPEWPKISIVTPSFNQGQFIEETIRSVLLQNYPNLEYIIFDGASSDITLEIIRQYDPWITHWKSEPDKGQSDAINKGIQLSTGEIFNWLNSDDLYAPGALYQIAKNFVQYKADIVGGKEYRFGEEMTPFVHPGSTILPKLEETVFLAHNVQPCTFFRLSFIKEFRLDPQFHYLMDADLFTRYLLKYGQDKIIKTDQVISHFRLHPQSKTVSQRIKFESDRWSIRWGVIRNEIDNESMREVLTSFQEYFPLRDTDYGQAAKAFDPRAYLEAYLWNLTMIHQTRHNNEMAGRCFRLTLQKSGLKLLKRRHFTRLFLKYALLPAGILNSITRNKTRLS